MRLPVLGLSLYLLTTLSACTSLTPQDRTVAQDFGLAAGAFTAWGIRFKYSPKFKQEGDKPERHTYLGLGLNLPRIFGKESVAGTVFKYYQVPSTYVATDNQF